MATLPELLLPAHQYALQTSSSNITITTNWIYTIFSTHKTRGTDITQRLWNATSVEICSTPAQLYEKS